jgi:transcriptional regulator with PAS, ATPase and Fis domain
VEELIRNRRFEEALVGLGEIDSESVSPDEKAFFGLLLVEASLYTGNYEVGDILEKTIHFYKSGPDNDMYARARFLQGLRLTMLGNFPGAKEALLESYVNYKRCENVRGQARALNRLAFIAYTTGDIESSIGFLNQCLDIYDRTSDANNKASIQLNLAQLLFASGRLLQSIEQYRESESAILGCGPKSTCIFYSMSAIPHALKGDFSTAKRIIEKAKDYYDNYPREKAIYFENIGWINLLERDYNSAEKALLEGLEISIGVAPQSALVSQIKRRLGDAYLGLGNYEAAGKYTDEAFMLSEELNERAEVAACNRIYAQLKAIEGQDLPALNRFKKSIDLFALIGAKYETAVTRYLAARSGLYSNGERQALLYLAREYFEKEKVCKYTDKFESGVSLISNSLPRLKDSDERPPVIVTVNLEMRRLMELAENVAASEMSVLLSGPTGTGKDLFAQLIHYHSGREGRFVAVNSAAIPASMVEAELFGHRKGSFTGAGYDKEGLIEAAEGGTLYLNEITESSSEFQSKLLDVLEHKKIRRLGETNERHVDFRLITATNHNLEQRVREGFFRVDLYHRINEVSINLPPLRNRRGDISALARYFLDKAGVDTNGDREAFDRLIKSFDVEDWPGNVRQLQSEIRRLALLSDGNIARMALEAEGRTPHERIRLSDMLQETNWNRREVARRLHLSETTIRRRIKAYNLKPPVQ